jgi:soluble lytic murein transglycosylase-like protein
MRRPQKSRRDIAGFSPHLRPVVELPKAPIVSALSTEIFFMKSFPKFVFAAMVALLVSPDAMAQSRAQYESMVASHARANNVPEALVHRVIVRESKYHPSLVGRGGTIGLMQIKLPTARGLGYTGDAAGLRDPDTNLNWGVKYLAGAYRAANGDYSRAVHYYASGYYYAAKRQRQDKPLQASPVLASEAAPKIVAAPVGRAKTPAEANALQTAK